MVVHPGNTLANALMYKYKNIISETEISRIQNKKRAIVVAKK